MDYQKILMRKIPLLIIGESGTGKSKLARQIHQQSTFKNDPFVTANLATLSEDLFESELFGHEKGAFTGATVNKKGYLEKTAEGILFLDEVGEITLSQQKKLLYLLEERKFTPVGSTNEIAFRGHIILATNKDLSELVRKGEFREDLYYRVIGFIINIESISHNIEKLSYTIDSFKKEYESIFQQEVTFSDELTSYMINYKWPGNYRELKNCFEYLFIKNKKNLSINDLPRWMNVEKGEISVDNLSYPFDYHAALYEFEKRYLSQMLEIMGGKLNQTAKELKMNKSTLIAKIKKYQINLWKIKVEKGNNLLLAS